jgi:Peptidase C13 family
VPDISDLGGLERDIVSNALRAIYRDTGVRSQDANLFWRPQPFAPGGRLALANVAREVPTEEESLYVFADLDPLSNWGHPSRHMFFSPKDARLMYSELGQFPPRDFVNKPHTFVPMHVPKVYTAPVTPPLFLATNVAPEVRPSRKSERRLAILFAGNSNNRHVNDLEFLFRVLCDMFGYREENIYVLNYDGTLNYAGGPKPIANWPGDNTRYRMKDRIVGAGNQAEFDKLFEAVAKRLKPNDTLLIHTNNHGGDASTYGEPWLCGYPNFGLVYKASDFGKRVADLPKCRSLIVSMEQCFSGGFMYPTLTNSKASVTSFAAAVPADKSSMGGPEFDPWALDWTAAFRGSYPVVSLKKCTNWA